MAGFEKSKKSIISLLNENPNHVVMVKNLSHKDLIFYKAAFNFETGYNFKKSNYKKGYEVHISKLNGDLIQNA